MAPAEIGNKVKVHYVGTLEDGSQFDSSHDRQEPIEFTLGAGDMIPGFEKAVLDMEIGDSKTIKIPADQAYGPVKPDQIMEVPRSQMPQGVDIQTGMQLQGANPDGQTVVLTVVAVSETSVTMDGNHPLAGKDLTFELELTEIIESTA